MISGSGISTIVDAAIRQTQRLDNTVRNISNAGTTGFKAERLDFLVGAVGQEPVTTIDYSQGAMQKTGNVLDMAIQGEGFFTLQTKDGIAYTRDGRATINEDGELVSLSGEFFLGEGGKISVSGNDIQILEDGTVRVDGVDVDTLKIVSFQEPSALIRLNGRLYQDAGGEAGGEDGKGVQVKSGCLELSNVQAIQEMVEMINIQRTFESYQKMIQTIDEQNSASTNRIGKL